MSDEDDPIGEAMQNPDEVEKDDGRGRACPITPLGHNGDLTFYYQTKAGDVIALHSKEHNGFMNLIALFGGEDRWQFKFFPITKTRKGSDGEEVTDVTGWSVKGVGQWLIHACNQKGRFDIERDLRGLGVWRLEYPKGR